jgi:hypothetical protein
LKDKKRKRITITCYDDEGYDLALYYPLYKFIETTEETGECVCRFEKNRMAYIRKTKAGYALKTWQDKERE